MTTHAETRHATMRSRLVALAPPAQSRVQVTPATAGAPSTSPQADGGDSGSTVELWLYGVVGGFWYGFDADDVADMLRGVDADHIQVRLYSPGGSAFEGIAIANLLRSHPATVTVVIDSLAASAASVIACAGDEVIMSPGAQLMIHRPFLSWTSGTEDDLAEDIVGLQQLTKAYAELYALRGGTDTDWVAAMTPSTWYSGEEAVEAGLADRVGSVASANVPPAPPTTDEDGVELDDDDIAARAAWDLEVLVDPAARKAWHGPGARAAAASTTPLRPTPPHPKPPSASASGSPTPEGSSAVAFTPEQLTQMRTDLGLPADADEAAIAAATSAQAAAATQPQALRIPEGAAVVDKAMHDQLRADSARLQEFLAKQAEKDRDDAIAAAVSVGKIAPARREHYEAAWKGDPEGTRDLLASLEPGLVPVGTKGHSDPTIAADGVSAALETMTDDGFLAQLGITKEALRA